MNRHLAAESTAERLRDEILAGRHAPGSRLDEMTLAADLDVSRNTLREAFRLLAHERLVEHEPMRGVFVRRVDAAAARDSYDVRRHLECAAVAEASLRVSQARRALSQGPDAQAEAVLRHWEATLDTIEGAVERGERAREASDWTAAGTANGEFHLGLAALSGNAVLVRLVRALVVEMRLRFLELDDPRRVHEPWVSENRHILDLLRIESGGRAVGALESYLLRAQHDLARDERLT